MRPALLAAVLFLGTACANVDTPIDANDTTPVIFEVPKGATGAKVGAQLVQGGFVASEFQWKMALRSGEVDASCIKAGKFEIQRAMSIRQLLATLCGPPIADDVPFTVVEGWRIRDIDAALAAAGFITAGAYAAIAEGKTVEAPFSVTGPTFEGYLWPETYQVPPPGRFDVARFVSRQLDTFNTRFYAPNQAAVDAGRGLHAVVIMASLLEREEPKPANRRVVAGLLFKRLDHGWQLGVDATSHYHLPEWNDRKGLLAALRDENDPYNTRLRKGLPPTAIGNPGLVSLESAMAPEDSPWWFYLHDAQGNFHGAKDGAGHEANRKKYNVY